MGIGQQDDDNGDDDGRGDDNGDDDNGRSGDDDGRVPVGGVETGHGGTAGGADLVLPLSLLGGGAATAAGVVLVRRRMADQAQ